MWSETTLQLQVTFAHLLIQTHTHTYEHTYTHTYTHVHAHTCTHTPVELWGVVV